MKRRRRKNENKEKKLTTTKTKKTKSFSKKLSAVSVLKVEHVVVCGHHGCGAVAGALALGPAESSLVNLWVADIRDTRNLNLETLSALPPGPERVDRLVELNVVRQVFNVCTAPVVQAAWAAGQRLAVHGLVYSLSDGLLRPLTDPVTGKRSFSLFFSKAGGFFFFLFFFLSFSSHSESSPSPSPFPLPRRRRPPGPRRQRGRARVAARHAPRSLLFAAQHGARRVVRPAVVGRPRGHRSSSAGASDDGSDSNTGDGGGDRRGGKDHGDHDDDGE